MECQYVLGFFYQLEKHFDFKEELKHTDLNIFYNQLDLFVLPSFNEALGCVYLESWATNTPFIGVIPNR